LRVHDEANGKGMPLGKGKELGQEEPAAKVVVCRRWESRSGDWVVGESKGVQKGISRRSLAHEGGVGIGPQRGFKRGGGIAEGAQAVVAAASAWTKGRVAVEASDGISGTQIFLEIKGLASKREDVSEPEGLRTQM